MITKTFQARGRLVNVKVSRGFVRFFQRTTVCTCTLPDGDHSSQIEDTSWGVIVPKVKVSSVHTDPFRRFG